MSYQDVIDFSIHKDSSVLTYNDSSVSYFIICQYPAGLIFFFIDVLVRTNLVLSFVSKTGSESSFFLSLFTDSVM